MPPLERGGGVGVDVRVGVGDGEERDDGERLGVGVGEGDAVSYPVIPQDVFAIEKPIKPANVAHNSKAIKILLSFLFMIFTPCFCLALLLLHLLTVIPILRTRKTVTPKHRRNNDVKVAACQALALFAEFLDNMKVINM
jgi:hypothetical protein